MINLSTTILLKISKYKNLSLMAILIAIALTACGSNAAAGSNAVATRSPDITFSPMLIPDHYLAWASGQIYKVGQAVQYPTGGSGLLVNAVHVVTDTPDLSTGEEWVLIDLMVANNGQATFTTRPLADFGVKIDSATSYYTESAAAQDLADEENLTLMTNTDVDPGKTARGFLAIKLPATAQDLQLYYAPGLLLDNNSSGNPVIQVSLGH